MAVYGPDGNLVGEVTTGTAAFASLTAQASVQFGAVLNTGACHSNHTMVVVSSAGVSAGSVQLQGSLDGVSFFNLGSAVTTNAASSVFTPVVVANQPVQYLRASIGTLISGGTVTVTVASA